MSCRRPSGIQVPGQDSSSADQGSDHVADQVQVSRLTIVRAWAYLRELRAEIVWTWDAVGVSLAETYAHQKGRTYVHANAGVTR